jgi:hypothetical protein
MPQTLRRLVMLTHGNLCVLCGFITGSAGADNNKLRLVFTQIDPADPGRTFYFSVSVDEDNLYQVRHTPCNIEHDISSLRVMLPALDLVTAR